MQVSDADMTSGFHSTDSPNARKYNIWSGWPAFSNNVLIRLARLEGEFHFGLPRLPCPLKISLVLSKQVNYHCQAMSSASSFF